MDSVSRIVLRSLIFPSLSHSGALPGDSAGLRSRRSGFQYIGFYWQQAPAAFASQLQYVLMVL